MGPALVQAGLLTALRRFDSCRRSLGMARDNRREASGMRFIPFRFGLWSPPLGLFFGDRLTVGRLALNQAVEVQVLLPELSELHSGVAAAGSGAWL